MTKAPDRIVTSVCGKQIVQDGMKRFDTDIEWMPADHALALVGTALHKAVHAVDTAYANGETGKPGHHIHPLIHGDAQAALERVKRETRNEALREVINLVNGCDRVSEVQPAIENLITED